jgi:hypothetical protein
VLIPRDSIDTQSGHTSEGANSGSMPCLRGPTSMDAVPQHG